MLLDTALLSRIQFAFTISFHILFPAFSIGLATFLLFMEGLWLATKKDIYLTICKFWIKIFALTFGMGIVSGIVMGFQLGTNWSQYTHAVGPALGGLFTYEVLTAFFIEAGFLGVMILGWDKVGPKLHYLATILVVIGVTLSAFWILSANSWMQYPTGFTYQNNSFQVVHWLAVIFNPLVIPRFIHMLLSAYIATGFVIAGISAYYLLNNKHLDFAKRCLLFVLCSLILLVPIQVYIGDQVGLAIHQYQPIKTAAIEGVWDTEKGAPLLLFAIPDQKQQRNFASIGLPKLGSLVNTHHLDGELVGLKSVDVKDQPWVIVVFYCFRIMVGLGILMLTLVITGLISWSRKNLFSNQLLLKSFFYFMPAGFIAILTGWFTSEIGRQPWVVQNYLRTIESASLISLTNVMISLILIVLVYGVIFGIFYFYYLKKIIKAGPIDQKIEETLPFTYMETASTAEEKQ